MLLATTAGPNTVSGEPFAEDTAGFGYFHSERHYRRLSAAIVKQLARGCTTLLVTSSTGADGDILARLLEGEKAQGYATALVCARPGMNFNALIHYYALWVGIAAEGDDGRMWSLLSHLMLERRRGITRVLIIEQAEALDAVCFDELLRFTQLDAPNLMPVVLLGSTKFAAQLGSASLGFLRTAIGAQLALERLDPEEVGPFLQYQINGSGNGRRLPDEVVATIAAKANGDPTIVNRLAREMLGEPPLPDEESAPAASAAALPPPPEPPVVPPVAGSVATPPLAQPPAAAPLARPTPTSPLAKPAAITLTIAKPAASPPPVARPRAVPPLAAKPAAEPTPVAEPRVAEPTLAEPPAATAAIAEAPLAEEPNREAAADDHARLVETARLLAPAAEEEKSVDVEASTPDPGRARRIAILFGPVGLAAVIISGGIFYALLPSAPHDTPVATIPIPPAPAPDAAETAPTDVATTEPAPPVPPAPVEPVIGTTPKDAGAETADAGQPSAPATGSADQPAASRPAPAPEGDAAPPVPAAPAEEKAAIPAPTIARVEPPPPAPPTAPAPRSSPPAVETAPPAPSLAAAPVAPLPAPAASTPAALPSPVPQFSPQVATPPAPAPTPPPAQAAPPSAAAPSPPAQAPPAPAPATPPVQAAAPSAPAPSQPPTPATPPAAPSETAPAPSAPPTAAAALEPKAATPSPAAATPSAAQLALMLRRGDQLMAEGDIISARHFFERAASSGDAAALCGIGRSYDPLILRRVGVLGITGDAAAAIWWYRKAADAGSSEAVARLKQLSATNPQNSPGRQ